MSNTKSIFKVAKRATEKVSICFDTDLAEAYQVETSKARGGRLSDSTDAIEKKYKTKIKNASVEFTFQALSRSEWRKLRLEHAPRDGVKDDSATGVNVDTFFNALIEQSCISPSLSSEEWSTLLDDTLSQAQWDKLAYAAQRLNTFTSDVPF